MSLFIRLVRAQLTFGVIFASYMVQLALAKVFRRWRHDPVTNHEEPVLPAWLIRRQARVDDKNSKRMLGGMLRLRGVYIKLGQVLSIMGGFLPAVYIKRLETLQDAVPPHPIDEIEQAFVDSLGARPEAFFRIASQWLLLHWARCTSPTWTMAARLPSRCCIRGFATSSA
jgi:hypothetical protein